MVDFEKKYAEKYFVPDYPNPPTSKTGSISEDGSLPLRLIIWIWKVSDERRDDSGGRDKELADSDRWN